nr:MFS transporter [Corynebacterium sp. UBA5992]
MTPESATLNTGPEEQLYGKQTELGASNFPSESCRLADIPLNRFHYRIAIAGAGGQFSDGFVLGIVISSATTALGLTPLWVGLLGAATLTGLFVGALITGPIADHIGRSLVFRFDMLFIACLSLSQFFVEEAWHLLVTRLLIGLVLGADYVVSKTLVTEHAPRHFRGRLLSFLAVAWAAGYVFAYLVGFALHNIGDYAWRYMLIASAIPELIVFAFRVGSPESPLWLMRRGLTDRARAIVDRTAGKDIPLAPDFRHRTASRQVQRPLRAAVSLAHPGWHHLVRVPGHSLFRAGNLLPAGNGVPGRHQ